MNDRGPFDSLALRQSLAEHLKVVFSYTHAIVIESTGIGTLDPEIPSEDLGKLLAPFPAKKMTAYAVSTLVNKPANERPECVEPIRGET